MREVRGTVQRIDVPAILAALIAKSLLFAQNIVRGPLLADAFANQHLGGAIGRCHQVRVTLVFDFQMLMEMMHQQRTGLASDGGHGEEKAVVVW